VANTSSAQKAMRQAQRRAARNQAARSAVRTFFKKASAAVAGTSQDAAEVVLEAVRALDKAAQRGIIHRNAAARRKSRLMARLHQLSLSAGEASGADTKAAAPKAAARGAPARRASTAKTAEKKPAARKPAARKAPSRSKA
jgi:small subunit ribosomal protein S20